MRLPNAERAIIPPEKLRDYLLSTSHSIGRYKAAYFRSLGYAPERWEVLEQDIRAVLSGDAEKIGVTAHGTKYAVRGRIVGPTGRTADIVTAWIILSGEDVPRFVTAYPED